MTLKPHGRPWIKRQRRTEIMKVTELLRFIGFKPKELGMCRTDDRRSTFFQRYTQWELKDFLSEAHNRYRQAMKEVHPDRNNGVAGDAATINQAWKRVKILFARRGITL